MKKLSVFLATVLVICSFAYAIKLVRAPGAIYIRTNGSIEPSTVPIQRDGSLYTLTGDIIGYDGIVVERDNIILDGANHLIEGRYLLSDVTYNGVTLDGRENVTAKNMNMTGFHVGISLNSSSGNFILANSMDGDGKFSDGLVLANSSNNFVSGNSVENNGEGVVLDGSSNNSIVGNNITSNEYGGFYLNYASYNSIVGNNIQDNYYGGLGLSWSHYNSITANNITNNSHFGLSLSSNNSIVGNTVANNGYGIWLHKSDNYNSISGNNITNNECGICLEDSSSSSNSIYHNNFFNNTNQVGSYGSANVWDDGYPSSGNYWSDYTDVDLNSDGIWDHPYLIDANNQDRYPLVNPWNPAPPTSGTIYIRADGSVEPLDAPIHHSGNIYTLTGNVTSSGDGIIIERNGITLDGAGYTVHAYGETGIYLSGVESVTVRNTCVKFPTTGIDLNFSFNNIISRNILSNMPFAIDVVSSSYNSISENYLNCLFGISLYSSSNHNSITGNGGGGIRINNCSDNCVNRNEIDGSGEGIVGLELLHCSNNTITENTMTSNTELQFSSGNKFYHNNFIQKNLGEQIYWMALENSTNTWDAGYPSGGNYWDVYNGTDSNHDGIGDTPYVLDANNKDRYPLMEPWTPQQSVLKPFCSKGHVVICEGKHPWVSRATLSIYFSLEHHAWMVLLVTHNFKAYWTIDLETARHCDGSIVVKAEGHALTHNGRYIGKPSDITLVIHYKQHGNWKIWAFGHSFFYWGRTHTQNARIIQTNIKP